MAIVEEKTLKELDQINLYTLFRQISLGNLVRAANFLLKFFSKVKNYLISKS